jgi:hypothetical protein
LHARKQALAGKQAEVVEVLPVMAAEKQQQ